MEAAIQTSTSFWFIILGYLWGRLGREDKFEEKYADAYCDWLEGCAKLSGMHGRPC